MKKKNLVIWHYLKKEALKKLYFLFFFSFLYGTGLYPALIGTGGGTSPILFQTTTNFSLTTP